MKCLTFADKPLSLIDFITLVSRVFCFLCRSSRLFGDLTRLFVVVGVKSDVVHHMKGGRWSRMISAESLSDCAQGFLPRCGREFNYFNHCFYSAFVSMSNTNTKQPEKKKTNEEMKWKAHPIIPYHLKVSMVGLVLIDKAEFSTSSIQVFYLCKVSTCKFFFRQQETGWIYRENTTWCKSHPYQLAFIVLACTLAIYVFKKRRRKMHRVISLQSCFVCFQPVFCSLVCLPAGRNACAVLKLNWIQAAITITSITSASTTELGKN